MENNRNLNEPLFRDFKISKREINEEARTVELAFSSETPVARWGYIEILDHAPESVRLGRMQNGAPLLVDHNSSDHIGVIESIEIGGDKIGRAVVRLGRSPRADEVWNDIIDGIRTKVSVGYRIHKEEVSLADGMPDEWRAIDWEPYEISMVSIPADDNVGVGRSEQTNKVKKMSTEKISAPENVVEKVDIVAIQSEARDAELGRIREINKLGAAYGNDQLARQFSENGKNVDEFRAALLESMGKSKPTQAEAPEIGLTDSEARSFSFLRAINAMANPTDRRAQEAAKFELEASRAASDATGKDPQGILVPLDVLKRELTVGGAGGNLVETSVLGGSFIELLRNKSAVMDKATILSDLVGNVSLPRMSGGAQSFWVAESGSPTPSDAVFDQVQLTPKTIGAESGLSRRLLNQSSVDAEGLVRADLAASIALGIDFAALHGDGAGNSPVGVANTVGIGAVVGGANGAAPNYSHLVGLDSAVESQNVAGSGYIINSSTKGKLASTEKAANTAQFIYADGMIYGHETTVSNQVASNLAKGTSTNCSAIFYGNWSDLIIGMWGGLDLFVQPKTSAGSVVVNALQDIDIAVRHPQSFSVMLDAITV